MNTGSRRILIAGAWIHPWYQAACATALEELGWEICRFSWAEDFFERQAGARCKSWSARVQNRLLFGPLVRGVNRRLVTAARETAPDVIWVYTTPHVYARTVRELRHVCPRATLAQFCNDNPFGSHVRPDYWRHLKRSIPFYDIHFVYRHSNEGDFRRAGARSTRLLRSYYVPEEDYPVVLGAGDERYSADVVFAGHFEDDGRVEALEAVASSGVRLNLFGGTWPARSSLVHADSALAPVFPVREASGAAYRKAICGAKIALCFLSTRNRDTYTRRNFQIPAMGGFVLSQYSDDLAELFREGAEIEFFRSREELVEKVRFYLAHDDARERIARAGRRRVMGDGHDVGNRMRELTSALDELRARA